MKINSCKKVIFLLPVFLTLLISCKQDQAVETEVKAKEPLVLTVPISLIHPGDPDAQKLDYELLIETDDQSNPIVYSLWVDSVICRDETCDVVKVKLNWDQFGQYVSYEVEDGEKLTKLDHVPFTEEDHKHLQRILLDKQSPLSEVTKEGLTGPKKNAAVDGVAGATLLTLKSTVVIGAGYTCYDLWHWANGQMIQIIRASCIKKTKKEKLLEYLNSDNQAAIQFAIEALGQRKISDQSITASLKEKLKTGNDELMKPALDYLKSTHGTGPEYYHSLAVIFSDVNAEKQIQLLTVLKAEKAGPEAAYNKLSDALPQMENHHEVHLFFTVLEEHKIWTEHIAANAIKLLKHKKFFVSRRAYWNLIKHDLSGELKKSVEAFAKEHEDRL